MWSFFLEFDSIFRMKMQPMDPPARIVVDVILLVKEQRGNGNKRTEKKKKGEQKKRKIKRKFKQNGVALSPVGRGTKATNEKKQNKKKTMHIYGKNPMRKYKERDKKKWIHE